MNRIASKRVAAAALVALIAIVAAFAAAPGAPAETRHTEILFVGNNWEGTADIIELSAPAPAGTTSSPSPSSFSAGAKKRKCRKARRRKGAESAKRKRRCRAGKKRRAGKDRRPRAIDGSGVELTRLARINIIPDHSERMAEIMMDPVRLAYFLAIRQAVGEGNDQFVDDMYSSKDGELLIVSRPSFADVVAIRISTGEIVWRFVVDGQRADHMGLSPDGAHVAVSASTGNVVHILSTETGEEVGRFESGDSPHENTYSRDGKRIYHASIGLVYTPLDQPAFDTTKGDRYFQVVDTETNEILERVDMGEKLAEAGYPDMSAAVRPMAITRDETRVFLQVSFFHGFVEYDLVNDKVLRVVDLPDMTDGMPREQYLLDSAHHGIALNGDDTRLCVAGTMSDYAAIVSTANPEDREIIQAGIKPYWSTSSEDGRYCFVSWSGSDRISVISYETRQEVARIDVGDHPQRIRTGQLAADALPVSG